MFGRKERKTPWVREQLERLENLRDDCITLWRDSGLTFKEVHERGGPTPQTQSKWLYKETRYPRYDTIERMLMALGHELMPVPVGKAEQMREQGRNVYLDLDVPVVGRPHMPRRKARG